MKKGVVKMKYSAEKKISRICNAGHRTDWNEIIIEWDGKSKRAKIIDYPKYYETSSKRQQGKNILKSDVCNISSLINLRPIG